MARNPGDTDAHLALAEAAEKLGLPDLSMWLILQGRARVPESVELLRALAKQYEARREWKRAIALWEQVAAKEPGDSDARQKINALSVQEHMATFQNAHGEPTA